MVDRRHREARGAAVSRGSAVFRHAARCIVSALAAAWAAVAWAGAVTSVEISSTPSATNTYLAGDPIEVDVRFDEAVTATGAPTFSLIVGGNTRSMSHDAEEGDGDTLRFTYVVRAGEVDADGVSFAANALRGGTIVSGDPAAAVDRAVPALARADAHRVDARGPRVERVRFTSNAGTDRVYAVGEVIEVTVTFDEIVTANEMELALAVGAEEHPAALAGTPSDVPSLVFRYTVAKGHEDTNGVAVAAVALAAVSGSSGSVIDAVGNPADLRLRGLPNGAAHRVDGIAPEVAAAPDGGLPARQRRFLPGRRGDQRRPPVQRERGFRRAAH